MLRPASVAIRLEFVTEARGGWPAVVSNYRQLQSRKMIFEITDYTLRKPIFFALSPPKPCFLISAMESRCTVSRNCASSTAIPM